MAGRRPKTRLELKRQREALARFERFVGALKRKQQKLQMALEALRGARAEVAERLRAVEAAIAGYEALLRETAGVDVRTLAHPSRVRTTEANVAGVAVPVFGGVDFPPAEYSLFATAAWVDRALVELRARAAAAAELEVLERRHALLSRELARIVQRVNLFEKVMIPGAETAIRRIRIHLGDEMAAAVGRAKLAKAKISGGAGGAGAGAGAAGTP
jgi:V/A-type H+/Na+-transporting ATPase subunit D